MEITKGTKTKTIKNMVYKLLKVLYSLKLYLNIWYERFSVFIFTKLGLIYIYTNYNILVIKADLKRPVLNVFVNEIIIIASEKSGMIKKNQV